jgi:hypothetical protein
VAIRTNKGAKRKKKKEKKRPIDPAFFFPAGLYGTARTVMPTPFLWTVEKSRECCIIPLRIVSIRFLPKSSADSLLIPFFV